MNKKILSFAGILFFFILVLSSCDDAGDETNPCADGPQIEIDAIKSSVEGKNNGEISLTASSGQAPFEYSLDGTNFQSDEVFINVPPDDYVITVRDANDCTSTAMATVDEIPEVFYASQIRPILDTNCQLSNCHGSNPSLPTFATYNDVKANALGIKFRTSAKTMPPTGALPDGQIQLIANWVDQGAPNN